MAKNKNPELKNKNKLQQLQDGSKQIEKLDKTKKNKQQLKAKPKKEVAVVKQETENKTETNKNVADGTAVNTKNKKNKQQRPKLDDQPTNDGEKEKQERTELNIAELSEKDLAKINKKKAKKLAQKLKKQQKKLESKKLQEEETKQKVEKPSSSVVKTNSKENQKKDGKQQKQKTKAPSNEYPKVRDPALDAATVFVGNLPVNTKRIQIVRLFQSYGPVHSIRLRSASGKKLFKHENRKKAGSLNAYVVLKDAESANRALALNGVAFKENHLRVTPADKAGEAHDTKRTIFVGNLKYSANEEKLRDIFSSCGEIDYIRCLRESGSEKGCKGVAYVCFKTPDAVGLAMELKETMLDERPIHIERYAVKKLGAKKARDASAAATTKGKKPKPGAEQRKAGSRSGADRNWKTGQNKKPLKDNKDYGGDGNEDDDANAANKEKKKEKFRGVKVEALKKKKQMKKKSNTEFKLAKKIAPKTLLAT